MPAPSNFAFLATEWPTVYSTAAKAESLAQSDPRSACFYARRALEQLVYWLYTNDPTFRLPYQDNLSALLHEPTFRNTVGPAVFAKARVIKDVGNEAVHGRGTVINRDHALAVVRELFHVAFWLARTYAKTSPPADALAFDPALLPAHAPDSPRTAQQLQTLESQLRERDTALTDALTARDALGAELERLRADVAEAKARNAARPDTHDYSEAETRRTLIDLLLREAGWPLDRPEDREYPVDGMHDDAGRGRVDYVLWGADGKPLALVEAKRTTVDPRRGQRQAELYANALEATFGRRPVIFCSNGYEHWIWDDATYPPRAVQGFYTRAELETLHHRRAHRQPLGTSAVDEAIAGRYYQTRAVRRIAESFDRDRQRKALLVMATGAGKTRTVVALADLLMRCGWAKRVLFLADRTALVTQAVRAFRRHLPSASPVNLLEEPDNEGRVYVSTYQTMMRLIDDGGTRRFGPGHFDLLVIDEAHRSVYRKYGAIFDWFDGLLVGLTATPKDEIDRNTYRLFDLENRVPTDVYELGDAVKDGFLVPPRAVSVPLRFQQAGIRYDELSEDDKEQWDALEWSESGDVPDAIDSAALNAWLFNADTVDKVLAHLMTRGVRVAGGDRIGKTIVFARNHDHARFVVERFDRAYPQHRGQWARVIDFHEPYAQTLIDDFSNPDRAPHVAVSVDMLDTGIEVPEVVNLVFFKPVRSKTKFWQMVGRGTRLRPDLFGPGEDKTFFYLFDYCGNVEFFNANPDTDEGSAGATLGERLFAARVELLTALDERASPVPDGGAERGVGEAAPRYWPHAADRELRDAVAERLRAEVEGMHVDNFVVRPHRRLVERYASADAWRALSADDVATLTGTVAGLPSRLADDGEEARRFDLLMLRVQLAVLRGERAFTTLRDRVRGIARALDGLSGIPMVRQELTLIQDVQRESWWQDVTAPTLEDARRRLRALARFIERGRRAVLYTDFEDTLGAERDVALAALAAPTSYEQFLEKARHFLRGHADHVAVQKLRRNLPLTPTDLAELERVLAESGAGTRDDVARASGESGGLGLFVRSLVGLDRAAAAEALGAFLERDTHSASQIEFVSLIVDHLTEHGTMPASRLWESPFVDFSDRGVDGVFPEPEVRSLLAALDEVRRRAVA